MHQNSLLLFERYARAYFKPGMRVLEIGPGDPSAYQMAVSDMSIQWETLDIYQAPRLTYVAEDLYRFPIPDETFDVVFSAQVIEHVRAIWRWIHEVARVCKVGGRVITINPVNWGFHEFPVDCWRMFPDGMKALYEEAGLEMELCRCESLERWPARANARGLKWVAKRVLGREGGGEPLFPIDTISVGVRRGAPGAERPL